MNFFDACLLCGSQNLKELPAYAKDYLCKCRNCGFVFARRIPTHDELIAEYARYPRTDTVSEITLKRFDEWLESFGQYRQNNNIIDIGAGDGHFIGRSKLHNWNAFATEFDEPSVKLCEQKGVTVHKGKLDPNNYPPGFFDIIVSIEVIEHINNPVEEIANFNKILRKGGLVYVTTPNLNSISHRLLKNKWNVFHYPEHLCYYTPSTLEKLFKAAGFRKVTIETTGFSPQRFLQSSSGEGTGRSDEDLRNKTEKKFFWKLAKNVVNALLRVTNTGDALKGTFIKL